MEPVQPEQTPEPSQGGPDGGGFHRSSVIRVGLLLVAVIAIAAAGIVIGKAIEPSSSSSASTSTTIAVTPVTTTTTTTQHAAGSRGWGPLAVKVEGSFPAGGDRAGAALAANTLVVAGGTGSSRVLAGPDSGTLVRVGALPGPRTAPIVFALGDTVYVIGGEAATTPTDAIFQLDTKTNKLVSAGTFEEPIAEAGVAARGGSAYLVGGWTGTQYATAVLKFTPPSTVVLVGRLPVGVRSAAVVLLRNTLYVAGGRTVAGLSRRVFAIDIGSGAVTSLGQLPEAVSQAVLIEHGTKLYLLGGVDAAGDPVHKVISIDPATGRPAAAGRMVHDLPGAAAPPTATGALVVDPPSGKVFRVG
jgi:hypothetical protein